MDKALGVIPMQPIGITSINGHDWTVVVPVIVGRYDRLPRNILLRCYNSPDASDVIELELNDADVAASVKD